MTSNARKKSNAARGAFATLRLDVGASEAEVKAAFKTLARAHHPDKTGGSSEAFVAIQRAYELAMDKIERDRRALRAMSSANARGGVDAAGGTRARDARAKAPATASALEIGRGEDAAAMAVGGDLKELGDERRAAGEFERAIECYDAATAYAKVDDTAAYAELYYARGLARAALDLWREAIDDADRAIAVRPLWDHPYALKGRALEALGAWSRAADLYQSRVERVRTMNETGDEIADDAALERAFHDGLLRVEAALMKEDRMASVAAHRGRILALAMAPPPPADIERDCAEPMNAYVGTIGEDDVLKIFSVPQAECLRSVKLPVRATGLKWSPTGGALVVFGVAGFVGILRFELASRGSPTVSMPSPMIELIGFPESVDATAIDFDRTGEFVAAGASDGSLCVWDAALATLDHAVPAGLNAHKAGITSLAFHPVRGRNQLTTGSLDGDGRVWDLVAEATETPGECLHTLRWKGSGAVIDVNYLSCGRLIVTSTSSSLLSSSVASTNRLLVWSSVSGRLCKWYDAHTSRITSFSWHPHPGSRNIAVTGCDDGVLRVWSIRASPSGAGKPLLANSDYGGSSFETRGVDYQCSGAPLAVAHSPMGGLVAVVSRDGYLRVHDSDTLEASSSWRVCKDGALTHVGWSPTPMSLRSGERLTSTSPWMVVTGGEDGRVCVWRVSRTADESEGEDEESAEASSAANRKRDLVKMSAGVFTSRDVKTWWDDGENASEVTPRGDRFGSYLGPSPGDKLIHKALYLGEAPEQTPDLKRIESKYIDLSLREGEAGTFEALDAVELKIAQLQRSRAEYMNDATNSPIDKRAYSARFATEMEPLRAARARVYAALKSRGDL